MSFRTTLIVIAGTAMCLASVSVADVVFHNGTGVDLGDLPPAGDPFWDGATPEIAGVSPIVDAHVDWWPAFFGFPPAPQSAVTFEKTFQSLDIHRLRYDYAMVFPFAPFPICDPITFECVFIDPMVIEPSVFPGLEIFEEDPVFGTPLILNDTGVPWVGYQFRLKDADVLVDLCGLVSCESDLCLVSIGDAAPLVIASDIGFSSTFDVGEVTIDVQQNADGPQVTITFQNPLPPGQSIGLRYIVNYAGNSCPDDIPSPDPPTGFYLYQNPVVATGCDAGGSYEAECAGGTTSIQLNGSGPGDTVAFAWSNVDCPGAVFDDPNVAAPNLTVDTSPGCLSCTVALTITDSQGSFQTCIATVTVTDGGLPVLSGVPVDSTVECDAVPAPAAVTASDDCDPAPFIDFLETRIDGECPNNYTLIRTWTATDECGAESSGMQTITVVDTTPPVLTVDTTPIEAVDVDCSGDEAVTLPTASASDNCGAASVSDDAPATFTAGQTTTVTYTATDDCGNTGGTGSATLDVTIDYGANIEIYAARHTLGSGSHPSATKEPLVGIDVCAYDKSEFSCARTVCGGISHQHYQCIVDSCGTDDGELIFCCTTDEFGECTINAPPGDYIVISADATRQVLPDPLGVSASDLLCAERKQKHLQQIVTATGSKRPGKTRRLTGSELLIIEPEYVLWDDSEQLYPFIFETIGEWGVSTSVAPPEGFEADYDALSAQVDNELEAVQFTITEVGSELVPTETTFHVQHNGQSHVVRSRVGIMLTPEYARSRGFNVTTLRAAGLIKERPEKRGRAAQHRP